MIAQQVAHIIAEYVLFVELTPEDDLDPHIGEKMMGMLGWQLENLDKGFLRELVDAFPVIAEGYGEEARQLVRDIPYGFYLEEALAADDPVRLAELDALREARD